LEKARPEAEGIVKKNFEAGGRPSGWAAKKDGSASHLMKSGNLVGGIRSRVEDRAIVIYTSGVAGAYAAVHQFGSDKQNIPARPYMIIPDDEKDILFQIIAGSIEETFNR
jgi:phage virion morphogenesis protein